MKYLKYILSISLPLLFSSIAIGQEKNYDIVMTEIVKEKVFKKDGIMVEKSIVIEETKKQEVRTKASQHHMLNQKRAITPLWVEKTIKIDDDRDNKLDFSREISYTIKESEIQNIAFRKDNKVFYPTVEIGEIYEEEKRIYYLGDDDTTLLGYFDDKNDFIIETY